MNSIKFTFLTLILCAVVLAMSPYALIFGSLSSFFAFVKCREIHLFFHRMTQDVLEFIMNSFDYADAVMGFVKYPGFGTDQDKKDYSVAYYDAAWWQLHSTVVESHCPKCAEIDAYHSDASNYVSVIVKRTV